MQISPIKPSVDATVGKVRTGTHAYYWWIFPNLMVNLYQGVMDTNWVLPLGPDRCRVYFDFYFADVESEGIASQLSTPTASRSPHQVQLEDWGVCEEVQRGLKSRTYDTGRFSVRRESGGYYFHQLLAKALRELTGERQGVSPTWKHAHVKHVGLTPDIAKGKYTMDRHWLLINTTYGTWLPGQAQGFVGQVWDHRPEDAPEKVRVRHNVAGTPCDADMLGLEPHAN